MSKIEEALRKVRNLKRNDLTVISTTDHDASNEKHLSVSRNSLSTTVNHTSSMQEIARMKNSVCLDNKALSELKIIFPEMLDKKIADTYRDLRTKLIQKNKGKNISVMLTSCISGYYSNLTSLNLAAAFSFDESKTSLLIDCNLNNPQLGAALNLKCAKGLTDYLENVEISIAEIIQESGIKRLRVIPAGNSRETATEYFTSLRMRELMTSLLSRYPDRYLFIDAAPIAESADTRILVELCDYVLLVVPYGKATKSRIKEASTAIGSDKLLGIVFSDKPALPAFISRQ